MTRLASLVAAVFVPDRFNTDAATMVRGVHEAFLVLGVATIASSVVFRALRADDGSAVSQHRAGAGVAGASGVALADVQPPSQ
jgi:hypothetical protein